MREVMFRGRMSDSEKWVFGYYCSFNGGADIFVPFTEEEKKANEGHIFSAVGGLWYSVRSETVGQFTGLTDKNGKKVFEGDIFATRCNKGVIAFDDDMGTFGFQIWWKGFPDDFATLKEFGKPNFEIIGNIYDNPELLEGFNG